MLTIVTDMMMSGSIKITMNELQNLNGQKPIEVIIALSSE